MAKKRIMIIKIKPLSVNQCWQGKRFKTSAYKAYEREILSLLPPVKISKKKLAIVLRFGFSSKASDIDNPVKPLLDILQKAYEFDDKMIFKLKVEKEIVKKGLEFVLIEIGNYE